ncbi:MAG TPA: hypothetical protein VI112_03830 [Bacteroidia bacterium]|jgi:hypothetical protein
MRGNPSGSVEQWVTSLNSGQQMMLILGGILFFIVVRAIYRNYWNIIDFFRNRKKKREATK